MKTNKTLKTVALAGLMGSALLLTGCGGGSGTSYTPPAEFGSIGAKTYSINFNGHSYSTKSLASDMRFFEAIEVGNTYTSVWNGASNDLKEILVSVLGSEYGVNVSVADINANIGLLSPYTVDQEDINITLELAAAEINSHKDYRGKSVSAQDVADASTLIVDSGATQAWEQGWVGTGVTLSRSEAAANKDLLSFKTLTLASGFAPDANLRRVGEKSDITISYNDTVGRFVKLERSGSDNFNIISNSVAKTGYAAGTSALVMQKFPTAPNKAVGRSVIDSKGNVLKALSPSM